MKILSIVLGIMLALTIVGCDEMENPFMPKEAVAADVPVVNVEDVVETKQEEVKEAIEEAKPEGKCGASKKGGDKKSGKCGEGKCGGK